MNVAEVAAVLTAQSQKDGRVLDLARVLSLATRIEAALVRRMRLALFPDTDAGLEANLWFSDLVEVRDALGIAFVPEIRDELRRQLALPEHGPALEEAWRLVEAFHRPPGQAGVPPVVVAQEEITYHALTTGVGAASGPASHAYKMQRLLGGWLRGLDDDSDQALASWVARALPALPAAARQSEAAMALAARIRASRAHDAVDRVPQAAGLPRTGARAAGAVLAGVRRRTDGLEVTIPPRTGAHELRLPATTPLVLQVHVPTRDGWRQHPVELEPTAAHLVRGLPRASSWRLTTAAGFHASLRPSLGDAGPSLAVFVPPGSQMPATPGLDHALRTTADELGWSIQAADMPSTATLLVNDGSPGHQGLFRTIRVSSFLRTVVGAARRLLVATPAGVFRIGPVPRPVRELAEDGPALSAEFDRDGRRVVTAAGVVASVYDVESGLRVQTLGHEARVRAATFSPDGQWIATGCDDGQVYLWSVSAVERIATGRHRAAVTSVEFDREGTRLVSASHDHTAVVWNVEGGTLTPATSVPHEAMVNHAAFDPSGALVVTASDDGTAAVWDCATGSRLGPLLRHAGPVHSAVWRPGAWATPAILTACATGECVTWNTAIFEPAGPSIRHDDSVEFAAFSPDGQRVVTGSAAGYASVWHADSRAPMSAPYRHVTPTRLADAPATRSRRRRTSAAVHRVDFSPDGRSVITAGADGRAVIWEFGATGDVGADDRWRDELTRVLAIPFGPFDATAFATELRAQLLGLDEERLLEWLATAPAADVDTAPAPTSPAAAAPTTEPSSTPADSPLDDPVWISFTEENGQLMVVVATARGTERGRSVVDPNAIAELTARARRPRRLDSGIGQRLFEMLLPRESGDLVARASALQIAVDARFAGAPWELLHDPREPLPVAVRCPVARTLQSPDSAPRRAISPVRLRRALVITAPGSPNRPSGPPAAPEELVRMLRSMGLEVEHVEHPTRADVIRSLETRDFDLLHVAAPVRSSLQGDPAGGLVFADGAMVTAADFQVRALSGRSLVFLDLDTEGTYDPWSYSTTDLAVGLVRARSGAVIARSLTVEPVAAATFAGVVYRALFEGRTLPEAVLKGRQTLHEQFPGDLGWGAYQCYCDPDYRLELAPGAVR